MRIVRARRMSLLVWQSLHATWDLLGFGGWRTRARESVCNRTDGRGRRIECVALCRARRSHPTRSAAEADRAPLSIPQAHHDRCPGLIVDSGCRCELGRDDLSESAYGRACAAVPN